MPPLQVYLAAGTVYGLEGQLSELEDAARCIHSGTDETELADLEFQEATAAAQVHHAEIQVRALPYAQVEAKRGGTSSPTRVVSKPLYLSVPAVSSRLRGYGPPRMPPNPPFQSAALLSLNYSLDNIRLPNLCHLPLTNSLTLAIEAPTPPQDQLP